MGRGEGVVGLVGGVVGSVGGVVGSVEVGCASCGGIVDLLGGSVSSNKTVVWLNMVILV